MAITANRRLRSVEARVFRDDHGVLIWFLLRLFLTNLFLVEGKFEHQITKATYAEYFSNCLSVS